MLTFANDGGGAGRRRARRRRRWRRRVRRRHVLRHASAASRRRRMPSRCASITASPSCPTPTTSRASTTRAPVSARSSTPTTPRRSPTPLVQRFIRRHRLEKVDPSARVSDAKKPIRYYVDRGTPEPIRTALLEGARWWNQAFEAAGYRNAFQVELLPEGADPMDIRYNMINWVHRSTRGWSTGASISDPRTGEIIKATVTLGSLRDRQDYLIFEGLLAPYKTGTETPAILAQTAMARIRQLVGARGRPHARHRPPVLQQHQGPHLGDGLSAPAREAQRRRHDRSVRRLRGRHRRVGQGRDRATATRTSRPAPTRPPRSGRSWTMRGRRT